MCVVLFLGSLFCPTDLRVWFSQYHTTFLMAVWSEVREPGYLLALSFSRLSLSLPSSFPHTHFKLGVLASIKMPPAFWQGLQWLWVAFGHFNSVLPNSMNIVYLSICLCQPRFLSLVSYSLPCTGILPPLGRSAPKYFILFDAMVNWIVSLISDSSLFVYRNATDFLNINFCNKL